MIDTKVTALDLSLFGRHRLWRHEGVRGAVSLGLRSGPGGTELRGIASIDATGQRAPYSPKWALSVTPSWDHELGARAEFYSYAQYSYTSSYGTGVTQSIYTQVPNQFTLNLRAGVQLQDGKYDVSLYANNATNEKKHHFASTVGGALGCGRDGVSRPDRYL